MVCEPGAFLECTANGRVRRCNPAGDGSFEVRCDKGCNASGGCNACEPGVARCSPAAVDQVERCAADGVTFEPLATCSTLCLSQLDSQPNAHCAYFQPPYDVLKTECDALATAGLLRVDTDTTLDSNVTSTCTGGVRSQLGGPDVCVVRPSAIEIPTARVKLAGARAFAFIADGDISIGGAIDASADGAIDGPGGGTRISGAAPSGSIGGGGAGFRTGGGDGGGGGAGGFLGAVPGFLGVFHGGYRAASGGGGGAALMFVSCRGAITIAGSIDIGGGGGPPGAGAGGGGSGGVLVIAGLDVTITATAQIVANGGGGGGGGGVAGADGSSSSTVGALGGAGGAGGGTGGSGGARLVAPGSGAVPGGGGGGATGYVLVYTDASATPVLSPGEASPAITAAHLPLR